MGYFPFFMDIKGKMGLIVGGGRLAAHKVEKLLPFEPVLMVVAPDIQGALLENKQLICQEREFMDTDVDGKMFVIAASDNREVNQHVANLCRQRNILVNVIDDKMACQFLFPALVKEGKLTVGISTEGASPQTAAFLRSQIAAALPVQMEEILDCLMELRQYAGENIIDPDARSGFLKEAALLCMEKNRALSKEEINTLCSCFLKEMGKAGSVVLTGAGCGPFDLITVRGLNALRKAQALVYDDLLDERLLAHIPESCEKIYVGKRSGKHSMTQEAINSLLIEKAKQGKRVVRLKGGDPFVFGRGGEEILALKREGIETGQIPGITSVLGVLAAAGIPVTHRGMSRSFHVITGHTADTEDGMPEQFEFLARLQGTLVFLMGLGHLKEIAGKLMAYGKEPDTPAAVVRGNFDGSISAIRGCLSEIAQKVEVSGMKPPAVIVVGKTAEMDL